MIAIVIFEATGNVADDDEESLIFADESEWMDEYEYED